LLSKGKGLKKPSTPSGSSASPLRHLRTVFVFACIAVMVYAIFVMPISTLKFAIILFAPVLAELIVLDTGGYIWKWIKNSSPLRGLVTSVFVVAIGLVETLVNGLILEGAIILVFAVLLTAYSLVKVVRTRDLGIKRQDPALTVCLMIFLTSILMLSLGEGVMFYVLLSCSMIVAMNRGAVMTIGLTALLAVLIQVLFNYMAYTALIVVSGVVAGIRGLYVEHTEAFRSAMDKFSPVQGLIGSILGSVIGLILIIGGGNGLYFGIMLFAGASPFVIYSVWKYDMTRDPGFKDINVGFTLDTVLLLCSLLALVLGAFVVFAVLICCTLIVLFYKRPVVTFLAMLGTAFFLQGIFINLIYPAIIIGVGVATIAASVYSRHRRTKQLLAASFKKSHK